MKGKFNLAFIMPNWQAISEVWIERMIEELQDEISVIVCNECPAAWQQKIPCRSFKPSYEHRPILTRAIHRISTKVFPICSSGRRIRRNLQVLEVNKILINYASYALSTQSIWDGLPADVFVHCHGIDVQVDARHEFPPFERVHSDDYPDSLRFLSEKAIFIANSQYTRNLLLTLGIRNERIRLKYFGVEVPRQPPLRKLRWPVRLAYLGRLVDCKGVDLVIRAFEHLCVAGFDVELLIAGDGPLRPMVELLRNQSPYESRIRYLGSVDRATAAQLLSDSDIFTCHHRRGPLSNREEAFGVALIEAMAQALPVVTGRSGAVAESVIDGETGILFQSGDVEAHAEALRALVVNRDLRLKLGLSAWKRAKESFSMTEERESLTAILDEGQF